MSKNKGSLGCLYVILLYWISRTIPTIFLLIGNHPENSLLKVIAGGMFGFWFTDFFLLPMWPLNVYIFATHVNGLQKADHANWYSYFSWKPLIISIAIWLVIGMLFSIISGKEISLGYFNKPIFLRWFVSGNIIFLIASSLLWHYYTKKHIDDFGLD